ncbi:hypothetical protein J0H58_03330 [bacterium]|nr:hypothetical protein [bacterium]
MPPPTVPEPTAAEIAAAWEVAMAEAEREVAEQEAAEQAAAAAGITPAAAPATPAPSTAAAPPRRRRRGRVVFAGLTLVGTGVTGVVTWKVFAPARPAVTAPADERDPRHADLAVADTLLRAGRFARALAALTTAPPPPGKDGAVAYRSGLCLAALGRVGEADAAYRRAGEATPQTAARDRAALGRVRCAAAAGDREGAGRLLDAVVLRSGRPDARAARVLEECLAVRAGLEASTLTAPAAPAPFVLDAPAWFSLTGSWAEYLDWLPPDAPATTDDSRLSPGRVEITRQGNDPLVTARLADRDAGDIVREIAAAAGLVVRAPDGLTGKATGVASLEVRDAPLLEVIAALTGRGGWRVDGGHLVIDTVRPAATSAAVRRLLAAAPAHPYAPAARLLLGNLDFAAGRWREAGAEYTRTLETRPTERVVVAAEYNLALAELRAGRPAVARQRFLDVADRDVGGRWGALGWWWVGRAYLDEGSPVAARAAFGSASRGPGADVTAAAAVGACVCHVLEGDEDAARAIIQGYRRAGGRADAWAEFLSLWLHRAEPAAGAPTRTRALFDRVEGGQSLGPAGAALAARMARDLGGAAPPR